MKKTLITLAIIVGIIALAVGFSYLNDYLNQPTEQEIEDARKQIEKEFTTPENDLPEDERVMQAWSEEMTEPAMQQLIHNLSHQKIKSSHKWGALQITQERVDRLLEIATNNKDIYTHAIVYMDILSSWSEGDFSQAVEEHNEIWTMQSGNVGKAYDLMSSVEEMEYIELHFKKNDEDTQ
ncbi:DUF6241 domain-containing protein [Solibacillus sp. FSL W8-0474]|uniref:DUF6241 domain-containing protein n=1 Tax=Solibacillus sp. FSL W8-0474 TaxID=2975336 RepID=UPI0030FA538C